VIVFLGPPFIRAFIAKCASTDFPSSWAHGVGQNFCTVVASERERDFGFIPAP